MPNPTPLATRLEEAEASRELTYEVLAAVGYSDPRDWFGERGDSGRGDPVTSLDAALALVGAKLPGWRWAIGCREFDVYEACVDHGDGSEQQIAENCATPALALLAALLKALAQSPDLVKDPQ